MFRLAREKFARHSIRTLMNAVPYRNDNKAPPQIELKYSSVIIKQLIWKKKAILNWEIKEKR